MAAPAVASARALFGKFLLFNHPLKPPSPPPKFFLLRCTNTAAAAAFFSTTTNPSKITQPKKQKEKAKAKQKKNSSIMESQLKRRTRSNIELDEENFLKHYGNEDSSHHIPVMLGEVLDVFASVSLQSFVDCTLGAAGHASAIIKAHPEMKLFIGLDVDPVAHEIAETRIRDQCNSTSDLQVHTFVENYRNIPSVIRKVDDKLSKAGVDGILMDLGMSSMQLNNAERGFSVLKNGPLDMRMNPQASSLKAEDILNSWPDDEVGKLLREYGEESNWRHLKNEIVKARKRSGLHSTGELVDLIRSSTRRSRGGGAGGRQGWIKTAIRVFQALRIAVNDELNTLREAIHSCFGSLASGGRLAVISFHSLEDRIVKQAFLDIVKRDEGKDTSEGEDRKSSGENREAWIKQVISGRMGTILTKRPLTPCEKEETLNPRSRSAKLRVIQKV